MSEETKEILSFDSIQIMEMLPHRYPFLLVDRITECVSGEYSKGYKNLTMNEEFFQGHFPGNPVVPGVILCEILAQSVCVCLGDTLKTEQLPFFTGLDNVKLRKPVVPGDVFETKCEITRVKEPFYFAKGTGFVNGKKCVSAEFSFAITG